MTQNRKQKKMLSKLNFFFKAGASTFFCLWDELAKAQVNFDILFESTLHCFLFSFIVELYSRYFDL